MYKTGYQLLECGKLEYWQRMPNCACKWMSEKDWCPPCRVGVWAAAATESIWLSKLPVFSQQMVQKSRKISTWSRMCVSKYVLRSRLGSLYVLTDRATDLNWCRTDYICVGGGGRLFWERKKTKGLLELGFIECNMSMWICDDIPEISLTELCCMRTFDLISMDAKQWRFPKTVFHGHLMYLCIIWLNLHFFDFWCTLQVNRFVHDSRIGGFYFATHYRVVCCCTANIALCTGVAPLQKSVHILKSVCEGWTKGEAQNCPQNQWSELVWDA